MLEMGGVIMCLINLLAHIYMRITHPHVSIYIYICVPAVYGRLSVWVSLVAILKRAAPMRPENVNCQAPETAITAF